MTGLMLYMAARENARNGYGYVVHERHRQVAAAVAQHHQQAQANHQRQRPIAPAAELYIEPPRSKILQLRHRLYRWWLFGGSSPLKHTIVSLQKFFINTKRRLKRNRNNRHCHVCQGDGVVAVVNRESSSSSSTAKKNCRNCHCQQRRRRRRRRNQIHHSRRYRLYQRLHKTAFAAIGSDIANMDPNDVFWRINDDDDEDEDDDFEDADDDVDDGDIDDDIDGEEETDDDDDDEEDDEIVEFALADDEEDEDFVLVQRNNNAANRAAADGDEEDNNDEDIDDEEDDDNNDDDDLEADEQDVSAISTAMDLVGETASFEPYKFNPTKVVLVKPVLNANASITPFGRSGHRVVANDRYVYVLGGFNPCARLRISSRFGSNNQNNNAPAKRAYYESIQPTLPQLNDMWRFCIRTHQWHLCQCTGTMPTLLISFCAVLWDSSTLLVFGGTGVPFGLSLSNTLYMCCLKRFHWTQICSLNEQQSATLEDRRHIPPPGYGQAIVCDRKRACLYIAGGTSGDTYHLAVHRFDWHTHRWTKLADTPTGLLGSNCGRYRHEMALWRDSLYIFGGGQTNACFKLDVLPVFNLITNTWSTIQTYPCAPTLANLSGGKIAQYPPRRYCHALIHEISQDRIHIFGGLHQRPIDNRRPDAMFRSPLLKDIWTLDLSTLQWHRHERRLCERLYFHSAAQAYDDGTHSGDGAIYCFGGVIRLLPHQTSSAHRLNFMYRFWPSVPSLSTLAWGVLRERIEKFNNSIPDVGGRGGGSGSGSGSATAAGSSSDSSSARRPHHHHYHHHHSRQESSNNDKSSTTTTTKILVPFTNESIRKFLSIRGGGITPSQIGLNIDDRDGSGDGGNGDGHSDHNYSVTE